MIRSALSRLTLSYLIIIMALSIGFSIVLYRISSHELIQELRQPAPFEIFQPNDAFSFDRFRQLRISTGSQHLKQKLILFNLGALALGSLASYALARRTLRPIEEAMDAQSRFTADASHELRTPLTAMQTEIEVALRNKNLGKKEAKELLESNLEEVAKLKTLSDGLLRLAREEQLVLKPVAVKNIVDEAIKQISALALAKDIKITNQTNSVKAVGDQQSLKDTLVILLDNAVKYSPPGQSINVTGRRTDGHVLISVEDQGQGIKASDLPHIFERFYRADQSRSNNQIGGHGLGLSIAQQIVKSQKGQITAVSKPAVGSTFTIKLPAA